MNVVSMNFCAEMLTLNAKEKGLPPPSPAQTIIHAILGIYDDFRVYVKRIKIENIWSEFNFNRAFWRSAEKRQIEK